MRWLIQLPLRIWQTRRTNVSCAVLLSFALIWGAGLAVRFAAGQVPAGPAIVAGQLDLRAHDFRQAGSIDLEGDWQFYWQQLVLPTARLHREANGLTTGGGDTAQYYPVPATWNGRSLGEQQLGGQGYGTYRLRVLLPRKFTGRPPLALRLTSASTSLRVFANQMLVLERGQVADNAAETEPALQPALIPLNEIDDELELTIHVANFEHRRGGLWAAPRLGATEALRGERARGLSTDLFLCGALLIMGCYHLILYLLRPADRSPLYFGVLCLLVILRVIGTGDRWLVQNFPGVPFDVYYRLEYLSFYLSVPAFGLFIWNIFPDEAHRWLMRTIIVAGSVFGALVLFTPLIVFTSTLTAYQLITLGAGLYGLVIGIWAWQRERQRASLFWVFWLLLFGAVVHEILEAYLAFLAP